VRSKLYPEFRPTHVNATRLLELTVQNEYVPSLPNKRKTSVVISPWSISVGVSGHHQPEGHQMVVVTGQQDIITEIRVIMAEPRSLHHTVPIDTTANETVARSKNRMLFAKNANAHSRKHGTRSARSVTNSDTLSLIIRRWTSQLDELNTFSSSDYPELPNKDILCERIVKPVCECRYAGLRKTCGLCVNECIRAMDYDPCAQKRIEKA